jgi:hypothetical protein
VGSLLCHHSRKTRQRRLSSNSAVRTAVDLNRGARRGTHEIGVPRRDPEIAGRGENVEGETDVALLRDRARPRRLDLVAAVLRRAERDPVVVGVLREERDRAFGSRFSQASP